MTYLQRGIELRKLIDGGEENCAVSSRRNKLNFKSGFYNVSKLKQERNQSLNDGQRSSDEVQSASGVKVSKVASEFVEVKIAENF